MNFRILVPYWGTQTKYLGLLQEWLYQYSQLHLPHRVTVISDFDTVEVPHTDWMAFPVRRSSEYDFDHKGAIVCKAIQAIHEPVLVLDADALIHFDPEPLLRAFEHSAMAMPADEGAMGRKIRNRHAIETLTPKRCAGVLWFGLPYGERPHLVREYLRAFEELLMGKYYEERRLFEQHAWSMVAHWNNAPFLPRTLNWADHMSFNGPNPEAAITHHIGQRKWQRKEKSCP